MDAKEALKVYFGYDSYKPGQREIISAIIAEKDVLAIMPTGAFKILYVASERLESQGFIDFVSKIDISMVTVDEAHCISQWGQDFRPSYLKILDFIDSLRKRPIVSAFTATATEDVKNDIFCCFAV